MQVKLEITSLISDQQGQERYEVSVPGSVHQKGEFTYLQYKEKNDEVGNVPILIKIGSDEVIIHRKGPLAIRQQFVAGKETAGIYQTPFSNLPFVIHTEGWDFHLDHSEGMLTIHYQMMFEGSMKRKHQLMIKFRKDGNQCE